VRLASDAPGGGQVAIVIVGHARFQRHTASLPCGLVTAPRTEAIVEVGAGQLSVPVG
jgi:hypothetical protein